MNSQSCGCLHHEKSKVSEMCLRTDSKDPGRWCLLIKLQDKLRSGHMVCEYILQTDILWQWKLWLAWVDVVFPHEDQQRDAEGCCVLGRTLKDSWVLGRSQGQWRTVRVHVHPLKSCQPVSPAMVCQMCPSFVGSLVPVVAALGGGLMGAGWVTGSITLRGD